MTPQQIIDAGFLWPQRTKIESFDGRKREVEPLTLRSGFSEAVHNKHAEWLRLYVGGESEAEIKLWQIGGNPVLMNIYRTMDEIFENHPATTEPMLLDGLKAKFHDLQIDYAIGWLKVGGYLVSDPETAVMRMTNPGAYTVPAKFN